MVMACAESLTQLVYRKKWYSGIYKSLCIAWVGAVAIMDESTTIKKHWSGNLIENNEARLR